MGEKKADVMWFDFLFDKTGTLLNDHLSVPYPEPTGLQLIQQFVEKSGCTVFPNEQDASAETNNRCKRLFLLAFHIGSHLDWNLSALEKGLPLSIQFLLLKELVKLYHKGTQENNLMKCEKVSVIPLLLYHRWIVRAIVQQSSSRLSENKTNESAPDVKGTKTEENKLLEKLCEEESVSVNVLEQAVEWKDDVNLPVLQSLTWQEPSSKPSNELNNDHAESTSTNQETSEEKMDTSSDENVKPTSKVISSDEIVGQVCYDLGTLYFYKEDIEKAKRLFEKCAGVQHSNSSFYTVDKATLSGYYTACCSLLHCPVREDLVSHQSLMSLMEQSKYNGYKDLVGLLVKDNVVQEVPSTYRKSLEYDVLRVARQSTENMNDNLSWHVCCCNIVDNVLEGRCVEPDTWTNLENSTKDQFEYFIKICKESVSQMVDQKGDSINKTNLQKLDCAIRSLLTGRYQEERLNVLVKLDATKIFDIEKFDNVLAKRNKGIGNSDIQFATIIHNTHPAARSEIQVQISQLEHELKTTSSPSQVPNVLMQLHGLDPDPHKKHAKGYENAIYGIYIQDLKDDVLQDLLHVLFSKANQCTQRKNFLKAKSFLDFGFQTIQDQRKRYGNTSTFDKMSNFLSQEILVTTILMADENQEKVSDDLLKRIRSNLSYKMQDYAPRAHVMEIMVIYLLNVKEWGILAELEIKGPTAPVDYREIGRFLSGTCIHLANPAHFRKMAKNLWDTVSRIFTSSVQHRRMLPDGTIIDIKTDPGNLPFFVKFISKIKDDTCLSLIISCLENMRSLDPDNDEEDKAQNNFPVYNNLWPTSTPLPGQIDFTQVGLALLEAIDYSVTVHPFNPIFLKIQGDTFFENKNHLNALRCYLQSGAAASDFFSCSVPKPVWDNAVYRKMITCCSTFNAHTQVAVLCQFLDPLDYTLAFNAMKQTSRDDASEFYYSYIWDITLLEFVVNIHAKRGEHDKKQVAIQALGQPELNSCNPPEILQNARRLRTTGFLQVLAKQYL